MKKLITTTLGIIFICTSAAYSQNHSTQPKRDSTVKNQNNVSNPASNESTQAVKTQNSNATKNQNNKPQGGRATNAGKRTNANNESKVSQGGHAAQNKSASTDKASKQPAWERHKKGYEWRE